MKKLALVVCVCVLLISATGMAYAEKPDPEAFTISGYTMGYDFQSLPNGLTSFHLTAQGNVTGYLEGTFTFEEWGEIDLDPMTGAGSGMGKNNGIVTITAADGSIAVVEFEGETDSVSVWGDFKVAKKDGTGAYEDFKGHGDYSGDAGFLFAVTFTGKLKN
jgi:hypothetical protein